MEIRIIANAMRKTRATRKNPRLALAPGHRPGLQFAERGEGRPRTLRSAATSGNTGCGDSGRNWISHLRVIYDGSDDVGPGGPTLQ